jgi:hypothetical protein
MTKVKESIRTSRPARRRKPSKGQQVGYLRVSSLDQNEVRQLEGLVLQGLRMKNACEYLAHVVVVRSRTRQSSSRKVTSSTQCRLFSMLQCWRMALANISGASV